MGYTIGVWMSLTEENPVATISRTQTFTARFFPEAWVNDYAVEVDPEGETSWDATEAVRDDFDYFADLFGRDIFGGESVVDNDDVLAADPNAPEWVREWRGPFTINVGVDS